jgi:sirohydrochlorin ferrochelatase
LQHDGVLIVAHGSSNVLWNCIVEQFATDLRQHLQGFRVHYALLESIAPKFSICRRIRAFVEENVKVVIVLPCFITNSVDVSKDIPAILGKSENSSSRV